jgi:hypothetical protein
MLSKAMIERFAFDDDVVATCEAAGMDDADVWHDLCTVLDSPVDGVDVLLTRCLDGADDDVAPSWEAYVDTVADYVRHGNGIVLRPICTMDDRDRCDIELSDIVGLDVPRWVEVNTIGAAVGIARHGAGAMAARCCFYADAMRVMTEHGDGVLQYLDDSGCVETIPLTPSTQTWCGFASEVLTVAVELWCAQFDDLDERRDLYIVARAAKDAKDGV